MNSTVIPTAATTTENRDEHSADDAVMEGGVVEGENAVERPLFSVDHEEEVLAQLVRTGRIAAKDIPLIEDEIRKTGLTAEESAIRLGLIRSDDIDSTISSRYNYPVLVPGSAPVSRAVIAAYNTRQATLTQIRKVRAQLQTRWMRSGKYGLRRAVAVMSPRRREGRSLFAANLAVTFSQMGLRTLLVDASLQVPRQHDLFGVESTSGLAEVLTGRYALPVIHRIQGLGHLDVVTAGNSPPNASDLLSSQAIDALLEYCSERYDVVIVDTSASLENAESAVLAAAVGSAILVTRRHRSSVADFRSLVDDLQAAKVDIVGSVVGDW